MGIQWSVGQKISATRINARLPVSSLKSSNSSLTSTVSFSADSDLSLSLKASMSYDIKGALIVSSAANAAGDFQCRFAWTNSATYYISSHGLDTSLASGTSGTPIYSAALVDASTPSAARSYGASTSSTAVIINDRIVVGASDITLTLEWTQGASNANATTLNAGSYITAYPVL